MFPKVLQRERPNDKYNTTRHARTKSETLDMRHVIDTIIKGKAECVTFECYFEVQLVKKKRSESRFKFNLKYVRTHKHNKMKTM